MRTRAVYLTVLLACATQCSTNAPGPTDGAADVPVADTTLDVPVADTSPRPDAANDGGTAPGALLAQPDLHYLGAFRVPADGSFDYGGFALGYHPGNPGSLFISCLTTEQTIAEISIPDPVNSTDVSTLPTATTVQPCADPTLGAPRDIGSGSAYVGGMLVLDGKLITTKYLFYDATDSQTAAFFVKPGTDLSRADATGAFTVSNPAGGAGYVDGWMAPVPAAWQSMLGGPVLAGNCCLSVITRTSWGPAAFAFDPSGFTALDTPVSASALLYYTQSHPTLGQWNDSTPVNGTTVLWENSGNGYRAGGVIPEGFRSILYFGAQGTGSFCYGCGTSQNPATGMCDAVDPNCYDPEDMSKGTHGYPYRYEVMAYDLADLAAVRSGAKQPWDVRPYGVWDLTTPSIPGFDGLSNEHAGGAVYDPATRRIYFSAPGGDDPRPLVHVWRVGA